MTADDSHDDKTQPYFALNSGTIISHYKILKKIGAGGMGAVYLANDSKLNREVALKFLLPHLCQNEDFRKRFIREAQAAAILDHPNIATIYEVSEFQGSPFYAMQVVDGQSLKDMMDNLELSIERILEIAIQICKGIGAAHDKGIIHRDIKPANILLDNQSRVRIVDFGLAMVRGADNLTKSGSTLGTIGYMSPEQALGQKTDFRCDLFSIGVILYELITKKNPFKQNSEAATLKAIVDNCPQPLAHFNKTVSSMLEKIVFKLLEKDPSHRYQNTAELIDDLNKFKGGKSTSIAMKTSQVSVAVLPFANLSGDTEQEYFCDGMAEEIINALTSLDGLRVVARTSSFAFKGKNEDIRSIGRDLSVDHIVEGSVRKSGNRIRITIQLVNILDGFHLWSEKYDRDLNDIFDIQDEISIAIAKNLNVKLLGKEETKVVSRKTTDIDEYRLYLRGRWLYDQRTESSIRESVNCFEQVIDKDPDFAPAYVGLSLCYCELPHFSTYSQKDALIKARQAAEKAIELDNSLAEAHTALGVILSEFDWEWEKAERVYAKAIELNPSSSETRFWYSQLLLYLARTEEAIQQMIKAQELDPLSLAVNKYLGLIYLGAREYESCEKTLKNLLKMAPNMTFPNAILGLMFLDKGMYSESLIHFQEEEKITSKTPTVIISWKAVTLIEAGHVNEANNILEDLLDRHSQNLASSYGIAAIYFALQDHVNGLRWLNQAFDERDYWLRFLKVDPAFRSQHEDPRFVEVLSRIGLV